MGRGESPSLVGNGLERVLQTKLQLAHGNATKQAADDAKARVGGGRRLAGNLRALQDVGIGFSEVRMVQNIESFHPELNLVMLVVGHAPVLVYFGVNAEKSRGDRGVSSDIAECSGSVFDVGATVPPARSALIGSG